PGKAGGAGERKEQSVGKFRRRCPAQEVGWSRRTPLLCLSGCKGQAGRQLEARRTEYWLSSATRRNRLVHGNDEESRTKNFFSGSKNNRECPEEARQDVIITGAST